MNKWFLFLFALNGCSEPIAEPLSMSETVQMKAKNFPQIENSVYGTWMETNDIYKNSVSQRRWFYISPTSFGIGQWCFKGSLQSFSDMSVPAQALDQTLLVHENLSTEASIPELPCALSFPKGFYGLNYNIDNDQLGILFPQTGEILRAIRYYAPRNLASQKNSE